MTIKLISIWESSKYKSNITTPSAPKIVGRFGIFRFKTFTYAPKQYVVKIMYIKMKFGTGKSKVI